MEIIGRVSKGSKMDQIYLPKNRIGLTVGNYVVISPFAYGQLDKPKQKPYFYGIKSIEPVKLEIANKVMEIIDKLIDDYDNIIIAGSFLDNGFNFNDLDILILAEKEPENTLKKEIEKRIGMKSHLIFLNKSSLKKVLEIDPLWRLMLSRCISVKRLLPQPRKNIDYKYLDAQLIKSKILMDNSDALDGKEKYKLIRNVISIYLFLRDKKISELNVKKEIREKIGVEQEELINNMIDRRILIKYRDFYSKLEEEIIKNAAKQEKTN